MRFGNVALTRLLIAGCKAALVPIEVDTASVTYDTSSYADIASAGTTVVQQCVSNITKSSGGWELAGRSPHLFPSVRIIRCSYKCWQGTTRT